MPGRFALSQGVINARDLLAPTLSSACSPLLLVERVSMSSAITAAEFERVRLQETLS